MAGAAGHVAGYDFIDIHGVRSNTQMQGRVIGPTLPDLRRIPNVIAIASEPTKAAGILGALRTGVIDRLATKAANALLVLNFDGVLNSSTAVKS